MTASNVVGKRPKTGSFQAEPPPLRPLPTQGAARAAGSPPVEATPPPKKTPSARLPTFKYLPAGYEVGKEPIGDVRTTAAGNPERRPLCAVVYPPLAKPGSRVSDLLKGNQMANGEKCNRPSKTWSLSDQCTAEGYAREHGYTKADGACPARPPAHRPTAHRMRNHPAAAGNPDPNAIVNDALKRRLCSITVLFTLAAAYEEKLAATHKEIAQLKRLRSTAPIAPGTRTPNASTARKRPAETPTPDAAGTPPPATKQRGAKPKARPDEERSAAAATAASKRNRQRLHQRAFGCMASLALTLGGGAMGVTWFVVMMVKSAVCPTGLVRRHIYLAKDVVKLMCDDEALRKVLTKELDARRKPKMAQFRNAQFSGVSISAMDQLRFASIWTPGHGTMAKAQKEWEDLLRGQYCPSGPDAWAWATTRTEEEQQATGNAPMDIEEEDEEDEDEDRDEPANAAREEQEKVAAWVEPQALELLAEEFPDASQRELLDKWSGGANLEGVLAGANPVQVCVLRDGKLVGLLKVLVTSYEVYVDELLVAEAGRRQGIALHLFAELCRMFPEVPRIRLQVKKEIGAASFYELLSFSQWKAPKQRRGYDKAFVGTTTDDSSRIFMHAEVDEVLRAATSQLDAKPDKAQLNGRLWSQASFPIAGGKVDLVVNEPAEDETEDDADLGAAQEGGDDDDNGTTTKRGCNL